MPLRYHKTLLILLDHIYGTHIPAATACDSPLWRVDSLDATYRHVRKRESRLSRPQQASAEARVVPASAPRRLVQLVENHRVLARPVELFSSSRTPVSWVARDPFGSTMKSVPLTVFFAFDFPDASFPFSRCQLRITYLLISFYLLYHIYLSYHIFLSAILPLASHRAAILPLASHRIYLQALSCSSFHKILS